VPARAWGFKSPLRHTVDPTPFAARSPLDGVRLPDDWCEPSELAHELLDVLDGCCFYCGDRVARLHREHRVPLRRLCDPAPTRRPRNTHCIKPGVAHTRRFDGTVETMLGRNWERVDGKVLAEGIHARRPSSDGQWYTRMKYVVEYQLPGAEVERVELKEAERFGVKQMKGLTKGTVAPLLVERKSGKARFDTDDPRINLKAQTKRRKQRDDEEFKKELGG
jgi:hypothetical protein